jgi:mycothiol synthase
MTTCQQDDWQLRPAVVSDLDGICELINAYSVDMFGLENDAKRNVEMTWKQPNFDIQTDTRVAVFPDGRIVGYGEVEDTEALHVRIGSWLRVHPKFRGLGLDRQLLDWIELRAQEAIASAPKAARVALTHGVPESDAAMQQLFEGYGYQVIRHFCRMVIELDHEIPEPVWPSSVTIRTFELAEDLEETVHAFRDSFRDHWGHVEKPFEEELREWDYWIREDEQFDPTLTFLAMADGQIIALASCDPTFPEDPEMGFIEVLGVRRAWRRQGIALALLRHSFREFVKRGQKRVVLGVDTASLTGAYGLYEAAGMKPTRQIAVVEKELRAGIDFGLKTLKMGEDA